MAFPVQISGIQFAVVRQLAPPFIDGNGNLYFVGRYSSDVTKISMMKSSNGGDTWSEVDSGNRPSGIGDIYCIDAFQDGDVIHIATQCYGGDLRYSTFRTSDHSSTDTWGTKYQAVATCDLIEDYATGCSIVVRSNGDVIIFYNGDLDGDELGIVYYAKYTDSWSIDNWVDSEEDYIFSVHGAVLGENDKVHFAYGGTYDINGDGYAYHKSLSSADSLSDWEGTGDGEDMPDLSFKGAKPVYYDDDGVERITGTYIENAGETGFSWEIDDDGSPYNTDEEVTGEMSAHDLGNYVGSFAHCLAVEGKTVYYLWGNIDNDIYYSKRTDGGAWTGEVELNDAVAVSERGGIVANVYTNGISTVVGYVYNDNGVVYYDELTIRVADVDISGVSERISVSESDSESGIPNPSVSENVSLSEYIRAVPPPLTPSVSDNISITENVGLDYIQVRNIEGVSDSVSVSEAVQLGDIANPDISDSVSVTDTPELAGGVNPIVSDGVSLAESVISSVLPIDVSVSDNISITEFVAEWSHVPIPVVSSENIHISEQIAEEVYNPPVSPRRTGIAVLYNVRLKNHQGFTTAIFDNFLRLEYELRVNDVGYYSLTFADDGDVRFSQFILDAQIEIWRSIPGQNIGFYKVFEGFHRKLNKTIAETGERLVTFSGVSYNDLLARTIIAYKAGTIRADKNAPVETVMKEYVEENCGPTADDTVVGRLYQGYLPNFSVEPTGGGGPNWEGSRAFENLLDILKDIGQQTAVDFEVTGSGAAEFEFKTYVNQMGEDRRSVDLDSRGRNPSGNRPVVFSTDFGFASDFSYTYDRMGEGNVVVVLGEGEGSTQTTITRSDEDAIIASPWNRCEVSRPGTSQEYEYQLNQLGDEVLEELKAQQFIEFTPMQQAAQMYGIHYDLGDRITSKSDDIEAHSKIVVIHATFEQDAEQIELELGGVPTPTSVYT